MIDDDDDDTLIRRSITIRSIRDTPEYHRYSIPGNNHRGPYGSSVTKPTDKLGTGAKKAPDPSTDKPVTFKNVVKTVTIYLYG